MVVQITEGIKVSVISRFKEDLSNIQEGEYLFTYHVTIENLSNYTIKLLKRHWIIFDSGSVVREVKGEGVVGRQPIIEPGQSHRYVSGCNLNSEIGSISGLYLMEKLSDGKQFNVIVPQFKLICPYKLN
ncbi:MAG: Co2+/Mg2+ efflux protein ApaG [Chitinophagaceae bacterium]|nr:MAG: Co2+/Mg2+ efflux protein ApaG [Chitinophagaceae bacterium]